MIKLLGIIIVFIGLLPNVSIAQDSKTFTPKINSPFVFPEVLIGVGLTTFSLIGDNSARNIIYPKDTISSIGGGINGSQPGLAVRATFILNPERTFRVVAGYDYMVLVGQQRIEASGFSFYATHRLSVPSVLLGFEYAFAEFRLARAKAYVGLDVRNTFVSGTFKKVIYYTNFNPTKIVEEEFPTKKSVSRLGMGLRLGVEGEISPPFTINMSGGYSAMNLFNPDGTTIRGQLLTPSVSEDFDRIERVIGNFNFTMMVQYKF